jgi:type I restriction enzyme, S subunit
MSNQFPHLWRTVELRQIASFVSGGTPSRKVKEYFSGNIPWLTGYDLPEDRVTNVFDGREQITDVAVRDSATNLVDPGTVLLTTRVTVGKVAIARTRLCFSQDVTGVVITDTNVVTPDYLAFYLLSARELLLRRNRGSTIQGVIHVVMLSV